MMKTLYKKKKGFTLIELIICLFFIALLASVLILSLSKYIDSAKEKVCTVQRSDLLHGYQAASIYYNSLDKEKNNRELVQCALDDRELDGKIVAGQTDSHVFLISGLCPCGGLYSVTIEPNNKITIVCTYHDNDVKAFTIPKLRHGFTTQIQDAFLGLSGNRISLDSTTAADTWETKIASTKDEAPAWKICYQRDLKTYEYYVALAATNEEIRDLKLADDQVSSNYYIAVYHQTNNETIEIGYAQIYRGLSNNNYTNMIRANSFTTDLPANAVLIPQLNSSVTS